MKHIKEEQLAIRWHYRKELNSFYCDDADQLWDIMQFLPIKTIKLFYKWVTKNYDSIND